MGIKKITYLVFLLFLLLACAKEDQEVEENSTYFDQWALVINYTAASCYNCGAWGAPLVHEIEESGKVVTICAHSLSDPMYTPIMLSFKKDRESGGEIPAFWVGDINTVDEVSTSLAVGLVKSNLPVAGLEISHTMTDTIMTVTVKSIFSVASTGEYYLSVFQLEDGIDGSYSSGLYRQSGTLHTYPNDDYTHDFVLRKSSVGKEAYGEKIIEQPEKDQVILNEYIFSTNTYPKGNVYPVAVLWKYDPSGSLPHYKFINAIK